MIEHQGIDFDAVLVGDLVKATQVLPIDLAIIGFLSSRPLLAFGASVKVAHVGILAEFAHGMQVQYLDAVDPLLLGESAIDDDVFLARSSRDGWTALRCCR